MIILKSKETSSLECKEQDRIIDIVTHFCEDNEKELCLMTSHQIESKLKKLVKENIDKAIIYSDCVAFVASHKGQYLHNRCMSAQDECMSASNGLLTIYDKKATVYDIAVFFRYKQCNNSHVEFLVKIDTELKQFKKAANTSLHNVDKVELL